MQSCAHDVTNTTWAPIPNVGQCPQGHGTLSRIAFDPLTTLSNLPSCLFWKLGPFQKDIHSRRNKGHGLCPMRSPLSLALRPFIQKSCENYILITWNVVFWAFSCLSFTGLKKCNYWCGAMFYLVPLGPMLEWFWDVLGYTLFWCTMSSCNRT